MSKYTVEQMQIINNWILRGLIVNRIEEEYDTADGWHVVKYTSGKAEATLIKSVQISSGSTAFPSLPGWYYGVHETIIPAAVADLFTGPPIVSGSLTTSNTGANFLITLNNYDPASKKHTFRVAILGANDYWTYSKKITITGKWK